MLMLIIDQGKEAFFLKKGHIIRGKEVAFIEYLLWVRHCVKCFPELSYKLLITSPWYSMMSWVVSPTKICSSPHPLAPVTITLYGNRVFTDIIKLNWGILIRVGPVSYDWCHYKKKEGQIGYSHWGYTQGKKVLWWQNQTLEWSSYKPRNAKDYQQPPKARRQAWNRFYIRGSRRNQPC